ncbi:uncharacterized protein THITE_2014717, partial [Thermothielavioides terrestris NRRL 8126]
SLGATRSRVSITATIRRKTSRLFGRNALNTPGIDDSPTQIEPLRAKRSWFGSVGARFYRQDCMLRESHESSQNVQVELQEDTGTPSTTTTATSASSPSETSPARSLGRHRLFRGRGFRLQSLPAKFRRGGAAIFRWSSSSGPSDEDKENMPMLDPPASTRPDYTGSWSSFRLGVHKAVR